MNISLEKYLADRVVEDVTKKPGPGPVITLSREYGCPSKIIAARLAEMLTSKAQARGREARWKYVTKEIMAESARALEVDPVRIKYVFAYEQKGILDSVFSAQFSKYYKSDRKIMNTVAKVIRNMAGDGHVIIVGRGGVAITHDIQSSLHIMLEAPLEWRAARVSENYKVSIHEARKTAIDIDRKRKAFRDYYAGKDTDYSWFDLTFNCMTLSIDEIVSMIVKAAEIRKMV